MWLHFCPWHFQNKDITIMISASRQWGYVSRTKKQIWGINEAFVQLLFFFFSSLFSCASKKVMVLTQRKKQNRKPRWLDGSRKMGKGSTGPRLSDLGLFCCCIDPSYPTQEHLYKVINTDRHSCSCSWCLVKQHLYYYSRIIAQNPGFTFLWHFLRAENPFLIIPIILKTTTFDYMVTFISEYQQADQFSQFSWCSFRKQV